MTVSPPSTEPQPLKINRQTRTRWWRSPFVIAGLVILGLLLFAFFGAPVAREGSTYERSPTGYSNWYAYMKEQGVTVRRWQQDYSELTGTGKTLIQIQPQETPLDFNESSTYSWIEEGNTLIRLSWRGEVVGNTFASQLESPVGKVLIETRRRSKLIDKREETLLRDADGIVVWSLPLEKGQIINCLYPWLAANAHDGQGLKNYEYLKYLTTLTQQQGGEIWVDEWLHGYRDRKPRPQAQPGRYRDVFDYLGQTPLAAMFAQGVLIIALLIFGQNQRFGGILNPKTPQLDNSERYIQALAGVINNARHTDFVLEHLGERLRRQLAVSLGLTSERSGQLPPDDQLVTAWTQATQRSSQNLLKVLQASQKSKAGQETRRLSDQDLLAWVSNAESILRGVNQS
jgi:hypothetical protein